MSDLSEFLRARRVPEEAISFMEEQKVSEEDMCWFGAWCLQKRRNGCRYDVCYKLVNSLYVCTPGTGRDVTIVNASVK